MPIPNVIKYSTTPDSKSLKVGNFSLGVSNSAYGETSSTGYWNGISPPTSGPYTYDEIIPILLTTEWSDPNPQMMTT